MTTWGPSSSQSPEKTVLHQQRPLAILTQTWDLLPASIKAIHLVSSLPLRAPIIPQDKFSLQCRLRKHQPCEARLWCRALVPAMHVFHDSLDPSSTELGFTWFA